MSNPPVIRHPFFGPAMPGRNWIPAPRYVLRRDRVFRALNGVSPCRVLDIGCGPATLLSELNDRGFETFGVDRSEPALELARLVSQGQEGMTLQAELDPAWKGTFDVVCSFEVIEHLDDDVGAMREWRDYLSETGRLILSTPAHPKRWNAADVWAGHVRRYERKGLQHALEQAGYVVEHIECYGFPLANVMEVLRARTYARELEKEAKSSKNADDLTGESGTDRSAESRFWSLYSSWPAALAMRVFCQMQRPFLQTDFGNGFLVVARAA